MCMLCYCCLIRPKKIALLKCSDFDWKKQTVGVRAEKAKMLKESVAIIDMTSKTDCIQYCLDRVKQEVGSFDPDEIFNVASQTVDPRVKARIVLLYVKDMVIDYLSGEKAQLGVVNVNGNKGKDIPKEVLEQGLDKLYHDIADEILVKIAEINGLVVEDGEVE